VHFLAGFETDGKTARAVANHSQHAGDSGLAAGWGRRTEAGGRGGNSAIYRRSSGRFREPDGLHLDAQDLFHSGEAGQELPVIAGAFAILGSDVIDHMAEYLKGSFVGVWAGVPEFRLQVEVFGGVGETGEAQGDDGVVTVMAVVGEALPDYRIKGEESAERA